MAQDPDSEQQHDDNTDKPAYQVLARKYRPSTFEDMIGQDAMVTTLKNAFAAGRVAHAFMMTGVRGIGKTTTARLLARALNYESDRQSGPSVELQQPGKHCARIMASNHMDVLEMDAASRTGVENMREMLDGVRYAPASARYKVYIIDEVHMLSTGAFNALLKTLEEPPDHAKFIFATTEIRKVPVTVLSRCQRFDLRRVDAKILAQHLARICEKESVLVSQEGLAMIARAAEGSVRDALSLLDQALVQSALGGGEVTGEQVRTMLGLADRLRIVDLFDKTCRGESKAALLELRSQYDDGADPVIIIRDLLDICHDISRAQILGDQAELDMAPDQAARMIAIGAHFSSGQLTRFWQILMAAHMEVRQAPVPLASAEMAILKLSLAGQMPPPELAAQIISQAQNMQKSGQAGLPRLESSMNEGPVNAPEQCHIMDDNSSRPDPATSQGTAQITSQITSQTTSQGSDITQSLVEPASMAMSTHKHSSPPLEPDSQPISGRSAGEPMPSSANAQASAKALAKIKTQIETQPVKINNLQDFVDALPDSYIKLKSDVERYVSLVSFKPGALEIHITDMAKTPALIGQIVQAFSDLTGELWVISPVEQRGEPPLREQIKQAREAQQARDHAHPAFSHGLLAQAQLLEVYDRADNIIRRDFKAPPE